MLLNMKELLDVAYKNKFAIGSFNISNSEFVRAVIDAAEERNSPAIIQIHPLEIESINDEFVAYVREAINKTRIPIAIHLDHGTTIKDIVRGIKNGYTSVMMDASHLSFEENVALVKEAVDIAHAVGVSVEGELGTIGSNEGNYEGGSDTILYTDPKQAAEFVHRTGVDTLAVAIGTSHGIYPETKDHSIDIGRLIEIQKEVSIPLVLHGGSDNDEDEIRETTKHGISKINLSSDMKRVFFNELRKTLSEKPKDYEPFVLFPDARKATTELLKYKMDLFNSSGKASLY